MIDYDNLLASFVNKKIYFFFGIDKELRTSNTIYISDIDHRSIFSLEYLKKNKLSRVKIRINRENYNFGRYLSLGANEYLLTQVFYES